MINMYVYFPENDTGALNVDQIVTQSAKMEPSHVPESQPTRSPARHESLTLPASRRKGFKLRFLSSSNTAQNTKTSDRMSDIKYLDVQKREKSWEKIRKDFDKACEKKKKKIRKLVRMGIPRTYKGSMWSMFLRRWIDKTYIPPTPEMSGDGEESKYASQIIKDVIRTNNHYLSDPMYKKLSSVMICDLLNCLSLIDKELGYTQGLNEVAGFMLSIMFHNVSVFLIGCDGCPLGSVERLDLPSPWSIY
ncbi:hypothetical protein RF11_07986 [Thelohanellus kitauei]|uniref:Rab-GAP TBC domain-containing protein n=1 Tax=Thelohanellus kitauei TaxID=669202 RepID=A0A0C2IS39_THEKT|nr:hypothetical protein RF11_07986 [Thelohanellus kitauei]